MVARFIIPGFGALGSAAFGILLDRWGMTDGALIGVVVACAVVVTGATVFAASYDSPMAPRAHYESITWKELEARFKELEAECSPRLVAGEVLWTDWLRHWWVHEGTRPARESARQVCSLAGAKLLSDPHIRLRPVTRRVDDDLERWFAYLIDLGIVHRGAPSGETLPNGSAEPPYAHGIDVCRASIAGCIESMRHSLKNQTANNG